LTEEEQDIRADILSGLISDKGGARMMWWISWGHDLMGHDPF